MRRPFRTAHATASVLALTLVLAGCAGPKAPLVVGLKEVPSDIVLGSGKDPASAPLPPVGFPILEPPRLDPFDDRPAPTPTPQPACPVADPRDAAAREASNSPTLPPAPGTYGYRNDGVYETSGANATKGRFPEASTRSVSNVYRVATPGSTETWFQFDVEATLGAYTTRTTYALLPERETPRVVAGPRAGLFISRVQTTMPDGTTEDFKPVFPGMLVLPFPATVGDRWNEAAGDPRSGTAMAYAAQIRAKDRVDACGTWLDTFVVRLDGRIGPADGTGVGVSPHGETSFVAEYAFGTQYGGLSLADDVTVVRTTPGGTLHQRNRAIISLEPATPATQVPTCVQGCIGP